jgi:dTDP-4-amino-4,6-dideoxygalactose transaminase
MDIPLFAPVYDIDACLCNIKDCLEKGWTGQGYKTIEFEVAWRKYTGLPHAHLLCTGTAGLNLAVETLKEEYNWKDGDEVISTPLTFVATNNAILFSNLKVVFADVDNTLCLNPKDIERKITYKTKAVIFVGLGGNTGHYEDVVKLCKKYKLKLILDAAHMAGTRLNGKIVGEEAVAVVYSFHVTKNLSIADAGMLCFKEAKLDEIVRKKSWNGIDRSHSAGSAEKHNKWDYDVKYLADAYNGNSIMASIGLAQLLHLDEENAYRRQIAKWYKNGFVDCPDKIKLVEVPSNCESAQWLFQIIVDDRDGLMNYLSQNGIGCGIHYPDNTLYKIYSDSNGLCPHAEYFSNHILSLPLNLKITFENVQKVIEVVKEYILKQS